METKTLNQWCQTVYQNAKDKGWYDDWSEFLDKLKQYGISLPAEVVSMKLLSRFMLMVTELAEATEEVRGSKPPLYFKHKTTGQEVVFDDAQIEMYILDPDPDWKPEGMQTELGDCVIRNMDHFGHEKWDLEKTIAIKHAYNTTRPFKHGGKTV